MMSEGSVFGWRARRWGRGSLSRFSKGRDTGYLCGCPVAASDHVGAARDLIENDRTGFVYPCADVDALAAVLRQAPENRGQLSAMGRSARSRMESWSPRENIDAAVDAVARGVARVWPGPLETRVSEIGAETTATIDSTRCTAHKVFE